MSCDCCFLIDTDNQRVIIKVRDINDEPPYFINRPLPMQVSTQRLQYTVYTVQCTLYRLLATYWREQRGHGFVLYVMFYTPIILFHLGVT